MATPAPSAAPEQPYLDLLADILANGVERGDRTGVGTRGVFGRQLRFDLAAGFPIVTTKWVPFKSVAIELLWFLRGDTNVAWLHANNVSIWDAWADADGELGPVYGKQWRSWSTPGGGSLDQIATLVAGLKANPYGRRHLVTAWNPAEVDDMRLPPCHCLFQFFVANGKLSCQLYQRSADMFLGVPFNIASYALLTHLVAEVVGLEAGEFIHTFGDAHLYLNHLKQAEQQLGRTPYPPPRLVLQAKPDIFDFDFADMRLEGYRYHPKIRGEVAV